MYTIYIKDGMTSGASWQVLHNPLRDLEGLVVIAPTLTEEVNTHGSLSFQVAQTNPLYDSLSERLTLVKVSSDTKNRKVWFGRVMSIEKGFNNVLMVYCEGELGCLCDSMHRPFGFNGSPEDLFGDLLDVYNGSHTIGFPLAKGRVSVTDPNNYIVRSSTDPMNVWDRMSDSLFGSSLGGYILPRYDEATDTHYVDYLALDDGDQYAVNSSQVVEFGQNLLNFVRTTSASDIVTVLIPYGATVSEGDAPTPASGIETWDGNRLTVKSVNSNRDYITNDDGVALWGRIVGSRIWDDVTIASNLLTKAQAWLAAQMAKAITIEASAVDLAYINADIDQIQVGEYVRVISKPHGLNALLLCTKKSTPLTSLEQSAIVLGAGIKTITDLQTQQREVH